MPALQSFNTSDTESGIEIVSENRGGVERDYMPDTQGNTVALLDSSQNKTDTWTYWPYGEVKTRTGTNPTPFTYVGTLGNYSDTTVESYAKVGYYRADLAQGQSVTPGQRGPIVFDLPLFQPPPGPWPKLKTCKQWNQFVYDHCNHCYTSFLPPADCRDTCSLIADWYYKKCKPGLPAPPGPLGWRPKPIPGVIYPYWPPTVSCFEFHDPYPKANWGCKHQLDNCKGRVDQLCSSGFGKLDIFCAALYATCLLAYLACLTGEEIDQRTNF